MSHLAFNEYLSGEEHACADVARAALELAGRSTGPRQNLTSSRSALALLLGSLVDVNGGSDVSPPASSRDLHEADLCTRFWGRIAEARLALASGSVSQAAQTLNRAHESPLLQEDALPEHLRGALLVERALPAGASSDCSALHGIAADLGRSRRLRGEELLVIGLEADLKGDRRRAADAFAEAGQSATLVQPPVRALALVCQAQVLDVLGEHDASLHALEEAVIATELRRNAVPFLGWVHQGTPVQTLLERLSTRSSRAWLLELTADAAGRADITSLVAPTVPLPQEREGTVAHVVAPALSPREREVLAQLARGATYADIAAALYVSENTVKTHVSSLYSKLSVSRRSEALAVARTLHLL